jgi:nucleoside-diphosphate-sugar epimerase
MKHLFCFGFGFTAHVLATQLDPAQWRISGTCRSPEAMKEMKAQGFHPILFAELVAVPVDVTHVLSSVPPDDASDPVLRQFADSIAAPNRWLGYLSTTGVYGDHHGGWVDEDTPLNPQSVRAQKRAQAEAEWSRLQAHIFRLPGIYGPGRSQLDSILDGTAKRVVKLGHVFCRVHVEDIAGTLQASMATPHPGRIYNVADDEPSPPQDVVAYAAKLLKREPPPEFAYDQAVLSPMARSFYGESKRVANARIKEELGYRLRYPNYRVGLEAILKTLPHPPALQD